MDFRRLRVDIWREVFLRMHHGFHIFRFVSGSNHFDVLL